MRKTSILKAAGIVAVACTVTLMNWAVVPLLMDDEYLARLKFGPGPSPRPTAFFRGFFDLADIGDSYIDLSGWKKGVVWAYGRNLGRYRDIGPQKRLFCPASFFKQRRNEIIIFDLHRMEPAPVRGFKILE